MTTTPAELRLNKDFADLELQPNIHLSFPNESSRMKFDVVFDLTKEECLWKGGKYKFNFEVPYNYPIEPPKAHCETPIYHPNIDTAGNVCLNILRADWKPVLNVYSVIAGC
jgi:ubiquitin-conjugating enzyme E2 M